MVLPRPGDPGHPAVRPAWRARGPWDHPGMGDVVRREAISGRQRTSWKVVAADLLGDGQIRLYCAERSCPCGGHGDRSLHLGPRFDQNQLHIAIARHRLEWEGRMP